eukprot:1161744-Pelagomonas_calceolata.AAC.4
MGSTGFHHETEACRSTEKASHECILHHPMAGKGARVLLSQAKMGSIMLPHRNYLNPMTCRSQ